MMGKRPEFVIKDHEQCLGPDYGVPMVMFDTEEHYAISLPTRIFNGLQEVTKKNPSKIMLLFSFGEDSMPYVADEVCLGINDFFAQSEQSPVEHVDIITDDKRVQKLLKERMTIN